MNIDEALEILKENNYVVEINEGKLAKALGTAAFAAGMAFGNSGVDSDGISSPDLNFGKNTTVHIQHRYDVPSTRYGVPTDNKITVTNPNIHKLSISEVELTTKKILASPDSMLSKYAKQHANEIAKVMVKTANKYNIDIDILLAIGCKESNFNANIKKSGKGAVGMMQIMKVAAYDSHTRLQGKDSASFDYSKFDNWETSIDNAGRIIADLSKRRGDIIEMILASYNGGIKQATAWRYYMNGKSKMDDGKTPPKLTKETKDYVDMCLKLYHLYKDIQNQYIEKK